MLQDWQNQVEQLIEKNAAFAVFRSAGNSIQGFASNSIPLPVSTFSLEQGFHMMPFSQDDQTPYYIIPADFKTLGNGFEDITAIPGFPRQDAVLPEEMSKTTYESLLVRGINTLRKDALDKFVFSRVIVRPQSRSEIGETFLNLLKDAPKAFVFLVNHPVYGMWMGATPETFLSAEDGILRTQALAGTRRVGESNTWGKKEIEEQAYVSSHIRTELRKADVVFNETKPETRTAGPVEHLLTKFEITSVGKSTVETLVNGLHPTPAVCGTPTHEAKKLIDQLEPIKRGYYTGFLGPVFNHSSFQLFVNLRSMQVFPNRLALRVGGGITKDSVIEHEWEETYLKAQTLLHVLK